MADAENPVPLWGTPEGPAPVRGRPPWGPPPAQPPQYRPMSPTPQWNPPHWNQPSWNPNRPPPRDLVLAYALLVLLGTFGLHKFYLRANGAGGFYLALGLAGWGLSRLPSGLIDTGLLLLIPLWLLLVVDFVTLPGQVRRANTRIWQGLPGTF